MADRADVHVRDLRSFLAVADELSFTRAAEVLFISQPALSKQVRTLETRLNAQLFTRGHRSIALTEAGTALVAPARRIVAEWDGAVAEVQAAETAARRTLVVGFHTRIGRGLVPAINAALAERLPGWVLRFRQVPWGDAAVGLDDGSVDVAVAWLPVGGPGIAHRVATTEDRWVAMPAGHRLATRKTVPFAELAAEPFVALPTSAGPMREFWLASTGPRRRSSVPRRRPRTRPSRRSPPGSVSHCWRRATRRSTGATTWSAVRCRTCRPAGWR